VVWDRQTATLIPVSVSPQGEPGDRTSRVADMSPDGRYVLFTSRATNLVAGDTSDVGGAFVRDMRSGRTRVVSLSSTGHRVGAIADSLSADGRVVFFTTYARAVPRDRNGDKDVYARNVATGKTSLVSVNNHGRPGDKHSMSAVCSDNGRWVAFESKATNLSPVDGHGHDVFLRDRKTRHTRVVSVQPARFPFVRIGDPSGISGDGQVITYNATYYGSHHSTTLPYVFRQDTGKTRSVLGYTRIRHHYAFGNVNSRHGNVITIHTDVTLTSRDTRPGDDLYLLRPGTGRVTLLTHQKSPTSQSLSFGMPILSRDGRVLFFETTLPFASTDTDNEADAYLRDIP
jgi:TolB protein